MKINEVSKHWLFFECAHLREAVKELERRLESPWVCTYCKTRYAEYVNGCPRCYLGEVGTSSSVVLVDDAPHDPRKLNEMALADAEKHAKEYLEIGPSIGPESDFINGFLAGNALAKIKPQGERRCDSCDNLMLRGEDNVFRCPSCVSSRPSVEYGAEYYSTEPGVDNKLYWRIKDKKATPEWRWLSFTTWEPCNERYHNYLTLELFSKAVASGRLMKVDQ